MVKTLRLDVYETENKKTHLIAEVGFAFIN